MVSLLQHSLYEGVPETEGCAGEGVEDGGVDGGVILTAVSSPDWQDVELLHVLHSQDDRKPLVIGYMLKQ